MTQHFDAICRAAELLAQASYAVALTGAGISVPSGIPDFRSPGSGLWEHHDPAQVASISGFRSSPARFYEWIRPLVETMERAEPNPGHLALAQLQQRGFIHEIITQNIDGLHQAAHSRDVLPLHGHTLTATCLDCGRASDATPLWQVVLAGAVPTCRCGGVYKPDVVLFGELLPANLMHRAQQKTQLADVMLVAGSSLEVYPVASFPQQVLDRGGSLIIVNLGETSYDRQATLKIEGDVTEILPAIVAQLS